MLTKIRSLAPLAILLAASACDDVPDDAHASAAPAATQQAATARSRDPAPNAEPESREDAPAEVPADEQAHQATDSCIAMCERTESLDCNEYESCAKNCGDMRRAMSACASPVNAFFACLASQPLANFECGDGIPSIKQGFCTDQQQAVVNCMSAQGG